METYTPDNWVVIKVKDGDSVFYKVLGGWNGGYLTGSSWRINSGISRVSQEGRFVLFHGLSGSIYRCNKNGYGLRMNNAGIWNQIKKKYKDDVELMPDNTNWLKLECHQEY